MLRQVVLVVSAASRSAPIKARTDRTNPSVWRKGKLKTSRRTNAVSIVTSENRFCPPGRPEGDGRHASVASAESHRVTSPHWTSARSYSRQFPTRYVVLYFGGTLDFIRRIVRRPRQQDQPVDDAHRREGQEPCTKASNHPGDKRLLGQTGDGVDPRGAVAAVATAQAEREFCHAHVGMGAWVGQHFGGVHPCLTTAGAACRDEHPPAVGVVTQPHLTENPRVRECARRRSWRPRSRRALRTGRSR